MTDAGDRQIPIEDLAGLAVLVVDDRVANLELVQEFLRDAPVSLQLASSGEEALVLCRQGLPDIAIVDLRMPGMAGQELIRRLRDMSAGPGIAIVALTADAFENEQALVSSTGCDRLLRRPFRSVELREAIWGAWQRHAGSDGAS